MRELSRCRRLWRPHQRAQTLSPDSASHVVAAGVSSMRVRDARGRRRAARRCGHAPRAGSCWLAPRPTGSIWCPSGRSCRIGSYHRFPGTHHVGAPGVRAEAQVKILNLTRGDPSHRRPGDAGATYSESHSGYVTSGTRAATLHSRYRHHRWRVAHSSVATVYLTPPGQASLLTFYLTPLSATRALQRRPIGIG